MWQTRGKKKMGAATGSHLVSSTGNKTGNWLTTSLRQNAQAETCKKWKNPSDKKHTHVDGEVEVGEGVGVDNVGRTKGCGNLDLPSLVVRLLFATSRRRRGGGTVGNYNRPFAGEVLEVLEYHLVLIRFEIVLAERGVDDEGVGGRVQFGHLRLTDVDSLETGAWTGVLASYTMLGWHKRGWAVGLTGWVEDVVNATKGQLVSALGHADLEGTGLEKLESFRGCARLFVLRHGKGPRGGGRELDFEAADGLDTLSVSTRVMLFWNASSTHRFKSSILLLAASDERNGCSKGACYLDFVLLLLSNGYVPDTESLNEVRVVKGNTLSSTSRPGGERYSRRQLEGGESDE